MYHENAGGAEIQIWIIGKRKTLLRRIFNSLDTSPFSLMFLEVYVSGVSLFRRTFKSFKGLEVFHPTDKVEAEAKMSRHKTSIISYKLCHTIGKTSLCME